MILDKITNANLYTNISERLTKAPKFLESEDFNTKESGRYEIDDDNLFYMVQKYQTQPVEDGKFEAHKKYIDIQFVAQGRELLGYAVSDDLEIQTPYDESGDCTFYEIPKNYTPVSLTSNMFCILFPQDGHMPGRQLNDPSDVLKVVVKVKVD